MFGRLKILLSSFNEKKQIARIARKKGSFIRRPLKIVNHRSITMGRDVKIYDNARIECFTTFAKVALKPELIIGDGVIINNGFTALIADRCSIGKNTIIAQNVSIINENHGVDPENVLPYHAQPLVTKEIMIGENVWIGCNVVFLPGASVGNNSIVGAGSIVNKSFPENVIIAGCPARIIKKYDFSAHKWIPVNKKD